MADSPNDFDTWIFELRAGTETEAEFAMRVAMFCVGLTGRSLGLRDRTDTVEANTLL